MGPQGLSTVVRALRIPSQERDMVKVFFDMSDAQHFFEVRADHPLLTEDLCTPIGTGELAAMDTSKLPRLVSGHDLQRIAGIPHQPPPQPRLLQRPQLRLLQRPQPRLLQRPRTRRRRTHTIHLIDMDPAEPCISGQLRSYMSCNFER